MLNTNQMHRPSPIYPSATLSHPPTSIHPHPPGPLPHPSSACREAAAQLSTPPPPLPLLPPPPPPLSFIHDRTHRDDKDMGGGGVFTLSMLVRDTKSPALSSLFQHIDPSLKLAKAQYIPGYKSCTFLHKTQFEPSISKLKTNQNP